MKLTFARKSFIITAALLMIGSGAAFAHGGWGGGYGGHMMGPYGRHMMNWDDYGPGMGPGYGPGYGPGMRGNGRWGALSEEDAAKMAEVREKFFTETEALRNQISEKRFALRNEMVKETPDANKAAQLQKELSALETEFDQKALAHRLEVRKLLPERSFGRGYGRGPAGGGYCW